MIKLKDVLSKTVIDEHLSAGYRITVCPVCQNETFDNYFVCPTCEWEYDDSSEDHYSACNGESLKDYRGRYHRRSEVYNRDLADEPESIKNWEDRR